MFTRARCAPVTEICPECHGHLLRPLARTPRSHAAVHFEVRPCRAHTRLCCGRRRYLETIYLEESELRQGLAIAQQCDAANSEARDGKTRANVAAGLKSITRGGSGPLTERQLALDALLLPCLTDALSSRIIGPSWWFYGRSVLRTGLRVLSNQPCALCHRRSCASLHDSWAAARQARVDRALSHLNQMRSGCQRGLANLTSSMTGAPGTTSSAGTRSSGNTSSGSSSGNTATDGTSATAGNGHTTGTRCASGSTGASTSTSTAGSGTSSSPTSNAMPAQSAATAAAQAGGDMTAGLTDAPTEASAEPTPSVPTGPVCVGAEPTEGMPSSAPSPDSPSAGDTAVVVHSLGAGLHGPSNSSSSSGQQSALALASPPSLQASSSPGSSSSGAPSCGAAFEAGIRPFERVVDGINYLLQGEVSPDGPIPLDKVGAVQIGPSLVPVETYGNTVPNLSAAVQRRIIDKALPFDASKESQKLMSRLVNGAMHYKTGIFSESKIKDWADRNPVMSELVSSKWAPERITAAFRELEADVRALREHLKFSIKLEALPQAGKAPRLLIADGDIGQLCALLAVKCFEDLLFARFDGHAIKHKAPDEALDKIAKQLRGVHGNRSRALKKQTVEGDGSAWDARCSSEVRDRTEMPILWHISRILIVKAGVPEEWLTKAMELNEELRLKQHVKDVDQAVGVALRYTRLCFPAIRRSGHRGTSCLNYWVNFCMWATAVSNEPWKYLTGNTYFTKSRWSDCEVYFNWAMEGDDSLLTLARLDEHWDKIRQHWKEWGFEMKLNIIPPGSHATFVGWNVLVDDMGPIPEEMAPEPLRGLASSAWSTSPLLRQGVNPACKSRVSDWHSVAENSYAARYYHMAGRIPWLAAYYRACAVAHEGIKRKLNRETQLKLYGHEVDEEVINVIRSADLASQWRRPCTRLMRSLGLELEEAREAAFLSLVRVDPYDDQQARDLFPPGMLV